MMKARVQSTRLLVAVLLGISVLLASNGRSNAQVGLEIEKECPATAEPGDMIECTIRVENQNPNGSITALVVTNQVPFPGGPVVPLTCDSDTLGPADGQEGAGTDFTMCAAPEQIPEECGGLQLLVVDRARAEGTDSTSGTVSASTTNGVVVFCGAVPEFPAPVASFGGLALLAVGLAGVGVFRVSRRR